MYTDLIRTKNLASMVGGIRSAKALILLVMRRPSAAPAHRAAIGYSNWGRTSRLTAITDDPESPPYL